MVNGISLYIGWLELREEIVAGAKRETEEETGMEIDISGLLGVYTLIKQKNEKQSPDN